ncbi:MAG TPA: class I SAM-dependent methyltransferase [Ktedonobacterales bacterium]
MDQLPGVHAAPNIQSAPDLYEIENIAVDPDGHIEAAMQAIAPWDDRIVLDIGAGTGFHIPRFHQRAQHVIAVEPHGPSRLRAMARVVSLGLEHTSIVAGSAERLFLSDASVDIAHARFAYFFAPDCEPGLVELVRVMRPGGTAFIIDNDRREGTFASWLQRTPFWARDNADTVEGFWAAHGFTLTRIPSEWRFATRTDLEAVVRLEFPGELGEQLISEHAGLTVDYVFDLYSRQF